MSNLNELRYQQWLEERAAFHTGEIAIQNSTDASVAILLEYKLDEILDMGINTFYSDHSAADKLLREYFASEVR